MVRAWLKRLAEAVVPADRRACGRGLPGPRPTSEAVAAPAAQLGSLADKEGPLAIRALDHVAIPVQKVEEMLAFYRALGFRVSGQPPFYAAHLGDQKINFHGPLAWRCERFTLRGPAAKPGCGDFCFVWDGPMEALKALLSQAGVIIEEGPVERVGGRDGGPATGRSVYVRDPDSNLLEFIVYA
jgi:catechol 2,3-dioxygenase-like lactoylglutathione lyase family enzyme